MHSRQQTIYKILTIKTKYLFIALLHLILFTQVLPLIQASFTNANFQAHQVLPLMNNKIKSMKNRRRSQTRMPRLQEILLGTIRMFTHLGQALKGSTCNWTIKVACISHLQFMTQTTLHFLIMKNHILIQQCLPQVEWLIGMQINNPIHTP